MTNLNVNGSFVCLFNLDFAYCEVGFSNRLLGDLQLRLVRAGNTDLVEGIPL
jgi:hypothetical protein